MVDSVRDEHKVEKKKKMKYLDLKKLSKESCLSVFTLRQFIRDGLPHFRVGRKILVDPEEYQAWFEEHHRAVSQPEKTDIGNIMSKALLAEENFS